MKRNDLEAFERYMATKRAEMDRRIQTLGDMSGGGILRYGDDQRWAFILLDVTGSERWRIQYFDLKGFSGHSVFDKQTDAIRSAVSSGFDVRDDGALDRVQTLPSFWRGIYAADLIRQINGGAITFKQGNEMLEEYDASHA